jgi:hypothetical protein
MYTSPCHLLADSKRVRTATHNITAWRFRGPNGTSSPGKDCDDDGPSRAKTRSTLSTALVGVDVAIPMTGGITILRQAATLGTTRRMMFLAAAAQAP